MCSQNICIKFYKRVEEKRNCLGQGKVRENDKSNPVANLSGRIAACVDAPVHCLLVGQRTMRPHVSVGRSVVLIKAVLSNVISCESPRLADFNRGEERPGRGGGINKALDWLGRESCHRHFTGRGLGPDRDGDTCHVEPESSENNTHGPQRPRVQL